MAGESNNDSSDTPSTYSSTNEPIITKAPTCSGNKHTFVTGPTMPKHIPFPEYSINSDLLNETIMFVFVISACIMQFINIFRTSWWLPESNSTNAVNIHMINPYLVLLIIIITGRRLVYMILLKCLNIFKQTDKLRYYRKLLKYFYCSILFTSLGVLVLYVYKDCTYTTLILLIYPAFVYLLIFGFNIEPFLRVCCEIEGAYFNNLPLHCCSTNPSSVRDEIETLKTDFNNRFKQVIFTSIMNAYYSGFVPCFFAGAVIYNIAWATENAIFLWINSLTMSIASVFPCKYSDIMHRASLHLGYWSSDIPTNGTELNFEVRSTSSPWNKGVVYANKTIVRYNNELFRAVGPATVAQPNNSSHWRFYKLFHNPTDLYMFLTVLQSIIIIAEISFIYYSLEWHFVLSLSFITMTGQFSLYKFMRDYLVAKRVYSSETIISEKLLQAND